MIEIKVIGSTVFYGKITTFRVHLSLLDIPFLVYLCCGQSSIRRKSVLDPPYFVMFSTNLRGLGTPYKALFLYTPKTVFFSIFKLNLYILQKLVCKV